MQLDKRKDTDETQRLYAGRSAIQRLGGHYKTLLERWNGTQWSVVPSTNVGTSHNALVDGDALGFDPSHREAKLHTECFGEHDIPADVC
jgi:hypothetical protein